MNETNQGSEKTPASRGPGYRITKALSDNRITLTRLTAVVFLVILLWGFKPWDCSLPWRIFYKLTGFLLVTVCVAGRIWAATYIGGRKTRMLVADGPYSIVRHPLYMFTFIGCTGIAISSMNIWLIVAVFLFLALYYPGVVLYEEQKMLKLHQEEYKQYMASVPRLIPNIKLFHNPEELTIKPKKFQRDLIHTLYFWLIYMLFETVNYIYLFANTTVIN